MFRNQDKAVSLYSGREDYGIYIFALVIYYAQQGTGKNPSLKEDCLAKKIDFKKKSYKNSLLQNLF